MKTTLLSFLCMLVAWQAQGQTYIKPVFTPESSPSACDGNVKIIFNNAALPYTTSLVYDNNYVGTGLHYENVCNDKFFITFANDGACRNMDVYTYITPEPDSMVILDTIIGTAPTPGNADGTLSFYFDQLPVACTKRFGPYMDNYNEVSGNSFTGLAAGCYTFSFHHPSYMYTLFSINVYLGETPTPCTYTPYEMKQFPASAPIDETEFCDGEVLMQLNGELAEGFSTYFDWCWYDGGIATLFNDSSAHPINVCRGLYSVAVLSPDIFSIYPISRLFVQDSSDVTTTWGEPGSLSGTTDTLWLTAQDNCTFDYNSPLDTVYVSEWNLLGNGQFELKFTLVQDTDTIHLYQLAILDSATNYFFDMTIYCLPLVTLSHQDHFRNLVYFAALDTRSMFFTLSEGQEQAGSLTAYPNPFNSEIQVTSTHKIKTAEVYALNGKLIHSQNVNQDGFVLKTGEWTPAVYLLKIYDESGHSTISRIVKMND